MLAALAASCDHIISATGGKFGSTAGVTSSLTVLKPLHWLGSRAEPVPEEGAGGVVSKGMVLDWPREEIWLAVAT
jgi:hypothetical protein